MTRNLDHEGQIHRHDRGFGVLGSYLPQFVYGGIDGAITTFAVVAGAAGAGLHINIVLILGFANLIADGFSMSVGSYLSAQAERANYNRHRAIELWEIDHWPENEREEVRELYQKKGFEGALLDQVVEVLTSDKERWADVMMREELEMSPSSQSPVKAALITYFSFALLGLIPLVGYITATFTNSEENRLFLISCLSTSLAFVAIGWMKSQVTGTNWLRSVVETLLLGAAAACLAYLAGDVLERLLRS